MGTLTKIFNLFIYLIIISNCLNAQVEEIKFEHITTDDGLSALIVRSILQDKQGYLWFGTYSGLDRYDGNEFKSFKNIPGDTLSITNGFVQCLLEDDEGNLWIGTTNGLDKFNYSTEKFFHFKPYNKNGANEWNNNIFALLEDLDGLLWVGTGDGLNIFNPSTKKFNHIKYNHTSSEIIGDNVILSLYLDKRGDIWIGTVNGLEKYDRDIKTFINYWKNPNYSSSYYNGGINNKYRIEAIYEDKDSILWICANGLLELNSERDKFRQYKWKRDDSKTISYYATTSICEENSNGLWIGTWNGLNFFNKQTKEFVRYYHRDRDINSLSHNSISALFKERSGSLWITTYGGGINKVKRTKFPFQQYSKQTWKGETRFSSASIMSMDNALDGSIWLSTPIGLLSFDPILEKYSKTQFKQNIRFVKEDQKGNLWLALNHSSGRGLIKYKKNGEIIDITDSVGHKLQWLVNKIVEENDSIFWACTGDFGAIIKINANTNKFITVYNSAATINTIFIDKNNLIWAGTRENGLLCFDPIKNKIRQHFLSDFKNANSISGNSVLTIFEDHKNNLWIGTNVGINKFDRNNNTFYNYTEMDGLPHNWVYLIFEDSKKHLWISTLKGISKFNPQTKTFSNYNVLSGLVAVDEAGVGCQTKYGDIFLNSPAGLVRFHPDSIHNKPFIPQIVFTNISIWDQSITIKKEISLVHSDNFISFEFAALDYTAPVKNQYAYKLEGFNNEWTYTDANNRVASYTNLDPGEYIFRVKGSNSDGIWNEEGTSVKVIIASPWWATVWAYIFYIFCGQFIFIGALLFERNRQKQKAKRKIMREKELRELQESKHRAEVAELQARTKDAEKIIEKEQMRSRIASDLHDEVGSNLSSIELISNLLEKKPKSDKEQKRRLHDITNIARTTADSMRDIVWFVNPQNDDMQMLLAKMRETSNVMLKHLEYTFNVQKDNFLFQSDLNFRRNLYLIYKEILQNIVKHSEAKKVNIDISQTKRIFKLRIEEDGVGFDTKKNYVGNGLKNLIMRTKEINGKINIESEINKGTIIELVVQIP